MELQKEGGIAEGSQEHTQGNKINQSIHLADPIRCYRILIFFLAHQMFLKRKATHLLCTTTGG